MPGVEALPTLVWSFSKALRASPAHRHQTHTLHTQEPTPRIPAALTALSLLSSLSLMKFSRLFISQNKQNLTFYIQMQEQSFLKITWLQKSGISNVNIWEDTTEKVTCQYASSSLLHQTPQCMSTALSWWFMANGWNQSWNNNQIKLWWAGNQTRLAMKGNAFHVIT